MTDKATVEITSPAKGKIEKLLAKEGETVAVGKVIVVIGDGSGAPAKSAAPPPRASEPKREMPKHEPPRASRPSTAPPSREESARAPEPALAESEASGPVLAAPATRKLARELGVDLGQVSGSGPRGRVTQEDVRSFAESRRSAPRSPS